MRAALLCQPRRWLRPLALLLVFWGCLCFASAQSSGADGTSSQTGGSTAAAGASSDNNSSESAGTAESAGSSTQDGTGSDKSGSSDTEDGSAAETEEGGKAIVVPAGDILPKAYRAERRSPENALIRFEIIAFGSYPITLAYTNFVWGLVEYVESNFDSSYIPWPFNMSGSSSIEDAEHWERMKVAGYISLGVALADTIIRVVQEKALSDAASTAQSELDSEMGGH